MPIAALQQVLALFSGAEPTEAEHRELFKEALLMTVARATASDTNVKPIEVEQVRDIYTRVSGEEISAADVRMAAKSKLYESAPLHTYLGRAAKVLSVEERLVIANALSEVILADDRVSDYEVDFFDMVAEALKLTPAELAGLIVTQK
ncbi:MAG: TerB family tellurite resistance protein [Pseudomonadota bacterium]